MAAFWGSDRREVTRRPPPAPGRLADPSTGREHVLLAELLSGDQVERGWGLYVHTPESASPATVQAPYATFATFSERQAAQTFDAAHAANLFVAGAHRAANDADEQSTEPANVTTNTDSVFHRIHQQVVAGPGDVVLQVLGTSGGTRDVTLTSGEAPPGDFPVQVGDQLTSEGYEVCLYGDGTCTSLASTGNVQGQWSRSVDAEWAALYPSFEIRRLLSRRAGLAEALAPALSG